MYINLGALIAGTSRRQPPVASVMLLLHEMRLLVLGGAWEACGMRDAMMSVVDEFQIIAPRRMISF